MKIKTLQLRNFKRFYDLTINLGDNPKQVIALIGPNGCGKSCILEGIYYYFVTNGHIDSERSLFDIEGSDMKAFVRDPLDQESEYFSLNKYHTRDACVCLADETNSGNIYLRSSSNMPVISNNGNNFNCHLIKSEDLDQRIKDDLSVAMKNNSNFMETIKSILGVSCHEENVAMLGEPLNILYYEKDDYMFRFKLPNKFEIKDFRQYIPVETFSKGEKEVLDILLMLHGKDFPTSNTLLLFDEPELHLHTSLQRILLQEICNYLGHDSNNQIWLATHSIGFMRALQSEFKENCQVIELKEGTPWASSEQELLPISSSYRNWQRIFEVALDDLSYLTLPDRIIICEGGDNSQSTFSGKVGLDAQVFSTIFGEEYPNTLFISVGTCSNLHNYLQSLNKLISHVFQANSSVNLMSLSDGDANPETSYLYHIDQPANSDEQGKKSKRSGCSNTSASPANLSPHLIKAKGKLKDLSNQVNNAMKAPKSLNVDSVTKELNDILELISKVNRPQENLQHRYLARRELENYLFDPAVLKAFADDNGFVFNKQKYDELIATYYESYCSMLKAPSAIELLPSEAIKVVQIKDNAREILSKTITLKNFDLQSEGFSYVQLSLLSIQGGFIEDNEKNPNGKELYELKLLLAKYIKPKMDVYKEIEQCIFGNDKEMTAQ